MQDILTGRYFLVITCPRSSTKSEVLNLSYNPTSGGESRKEIQRYGRGFCARDGYERRTQTCAAALGVPKYETEAELMRLVGHFVAPTLVASLVLVPGASAQQMNDDQLMEDGRMDKNYDGQSSCIG